MSEALSPRQRALLAASRERAAALAESAAEGEAAGQVAAIGAASSAATGAATFAASSAGASLAPRASAGAAAAAPTRAVAGVSAGDLVVLAWTAEFPVEWLVLAVGPAAGLRAVPSVRPGVGERDVRRLVLALADSHPLAGSRDFVAESSSGRVVVRAQATAAIDVDPRTLRRTGRIEASALALIHRKVHEVAAIDFAPDPFTAEVDASPDLAAWRREVIGPALAAATSTREATAEGPHSSTSAAFSASAPEAAGRSARHARSDRGRRGGHWSTPLAASLALVALGLTAWGLAQRQAVVDLETRLEVTAAALAAERAAEALEPRAESARREGAEFPPNAGALPMPPSTRGDGAAERASSRESQLAQEIARLERRLEASRAGSVGQGQGSEPAAPRGAAIRSPAPPQANLPVAILQPRETLRSGRGSEPLRLGPESADPELSLLAVVLRVREGEAGATYRVEVERVGTAEKLLSIPNLVRTREGLQLGLPRRLLAAGSYRLELFAEGAAAAEPLESYELTIAE